MLHMPHALCFCQVALVRNCPDPPSLNFFLSCAFTCHCPNGGRASPLLSGRASPCSTACGRASHKKERGRFQRSLELFCWLPRGLLRRRALPARRSSTTGTSVGASDRVSLRLGGGLMVGDRASAERFPGPACAGAAGGAWPCGTAGANTTLCACACHCWDCCWLQKCQFSHEANRYCKVITSFSAARNRSCRSSYSCLGTQSRQLESP